MEEHTHSSDETPNKINCPICRALASQPKAHPDPSYQSPVRGKEALFTPHKLVDGVMQLCHDPDCRICSQPTSLMPEITYVLDLPGPCPKCGDNSCCEGITKEKVFTLK